MTAGLFPAVDLGTHPRAGFRLSYLEVFNWGTFDKRVWRLGTGGETALLTGDIGSGKSTLVDALTTLLLPANRISYNKAAGAESKERTLRSYVEGHYKSESNEASGRSRAVGLRGANSYSVVLGVWRNEGFDETVTLAQVFQQRDPSGQPDRFFLTSPKALSIEADFTNFGADPNDLRRRLRSSGATVFNHGEFPKYALGYRRLLGIRSEQAMDLFHQTVSMKSVGNLNDFVRNHMLEPVDASEKVRGIVEHFGDLTKAHASVRRARDQLDSLRPLVATADKYDATSARRAGAVAKRDAVRFYVAERRLLLLTDEMATHEATSLARRSDLAEGERRRRALGTVRDGLIAERAGAGGDRITALERAAETAGQQEAERRDRRTGFDDRVRTAGIAPVVDAAGFAQLTEELGQRQAGVRLRRHEVDRLREETSVALGDLRRQSEETRAELDSLAGRTSNLPGSQLDVRARLCEAVAAPAEELPFAGELLDVADGFALWRGAAERVLRGFALSLLVPAEHYESVGEWVNHNRLTHRRNDGRSVGSRLVYERVSPRRVPLRPHPSGQLLLSETLEIKDGVSRDYLEHEVLRRADYVCAESLTAFRQQSRAVTREGQVRSGDRHEKDDRSAPDDPRSWVLGWVNERKVAALTDQLLEQQGRWDRLEAARRELEREQAKLDEQLLSLANLEVYPHWIELDHEEAAERGRRATAERERLLAGSPALAEIERRLTENDGEIVAADRRLGELTGELAVLAKELGEAGEDRGRTQAFLDGSSAQALDTARASYVELGAMVGAQAQPRAKDCDALSAALTSDLGESVERMGREVNGHALNLAQQMHEFRRRWPESSTEMDASVQARSEFRSLHERIAHDDLPRFEADFKRLLNTETIRELAAFSIWLRQQADAIGARVARINEALGAIDYSPGHYISIVTEATVNEEIRSFRADLRSATTDLPFTTDDHYGEQRFADVAHIIERFHGREAHADADRAWARRVTDVRNWFTFAASERDNLTQDEREHYRDSDGKSGGQKEKLAYTILAASLAYQFGLEWGVERARDFRFAVIDEAFGRGSDSSTRYALDLVAKLGLQLLIVTPLQKVHVIEPYVAAIGFVDNPERNYSRLQTLTIEEFRARRARHQA